MHNPIKPTRIEDFSRWRDETGIAAAIVLGLTALAGLITCVGAWAIMALFADDPAPPPPPPAVPACSDSRLEALRGAVEACANNKSVHSTECIEAARVAICASPSSAPVLERVASIEHDQWTEWSQAVADEVTPERHDRWSKYWVPYEELPEDVKELDREWARKVLAEVGSSRIDQQDRPQGHLPQ